MYSFCKYRVHRSFLFGIFHDGDFGGGRSWRRPRRGGGRKTVDSSCFAPVVSGSSSFFIGTVGNLFLVLFFFLHYVVQSRVIAGKVAFDAILVHILPVEPSVVVHTAAFALKSPLLGLDDVLFVVLVDMVVHHLSRGLEIVVVLLFLLLLLCRWISLPWYRVNHIDGSTVSRIHWRGHLLRFAVLSSSLGGGSCPHFDVATRVRAPLEYQLFPPPPSLDSRIRVRRRDKRHWSRGGNVGGLRRDSKR